MSKSSSITVIPAFFADRSAYRPINPDGSFVVLSTAEETTPYVMRGTQAQVFNEHKDKSYCIVVQPPGSGKSRLICYIHGWSLRHNINQKLIISVPQNLISKTFNECDLKFPDGTIINWKVGNNLCGDKSETKVNALIEFINRTKFPPNKLSKDISDRVMLCSHACLAQALTKIGLTSKTRKSLVNTSLVIDEGHHILNAEDEEGLTKSEQNELGKLVHFVLKGSPIKNFRLWIATATFFRGDCLSILTTAEREKFKGSEVYLPLDEHWEKNIKHIAGYRFNFLMYGLNGPERAVTHVIKQSGKRPTIVYLQDSRQIDSTSLVKEDKYSRLDQLTKLFQKHWGKDTNILDFVTEEGRDQRKLDFINGVIKPDVIFAIKLMDEGTDWPRAEQIIDLAPSSSLRILVQRFGRLIRDCPEKSGKVIDYHQLLALPPSRAHEEKRIERMNINFAALHAALLIEDALQPVKLGGNIDDRLTEEEKKEKGITGARSAKFNWFDYYFPTEDKRMEVQQAVHVGMIDLLDKSGDKEISHEDKEKVAIKILTEDFDIDDPIKVKKVAARVLAILKQVDNKTKDINPALSRGIEGCKDMVVNGGFSPIGRAEQSSTQQLKDLWAYTSGICGVKTFGEWRTVMEDRSEAAWNEMYELLVEYKEKNGHCDVKYYESYKGKSLSIWVITQRQSFKKGKLSQDKINRLNDIGFLWNPRKRMSFQEARTYMHQLTPRIISREDFVKRRKSGKISALIPSGPARYYKNSGWIDYCDFFGKEKIEFASLDQCRAYAKANNITTRKQWAAIPIDTRKKKGLPSCPPRIFKNKGCDCWTSFFGNKKYGIECRIEDVIDYVKKHNIKSHADWVKKYKSIKQKNIPSDPYYSIRNWPGWPSIFTQIYGVPNPSKQEALYRPKRIFRCPNGELFETRNTKALGKDFGLNQSSLNNLALGKSLSYKGWTYVGEAKN